MFQDYSSEMLEIIDWIVDGDFMRIKFIVGRTKERWG